MAGQTAARMAVGRADLMAEQMVDTSVGMSVALLGSLMVVSLVDLKAGA